MLERDSGPRQEARKEEKGKRKVAKVTTGFAGVVGKQDTLRQFAPRSWSKSLNAVEEDKGDISEEVRGCRKDCMILVGQTKRSVKYVIKKRAQRGTECTTARAGRKSEARSQRN